MAHTVAARCWCGERRCDEHRDRCYRCLDEVRRSRMRWHRIGTRSVLVCVDRPTCSASLAAWR